MPESIPGPTRTAGPAQAIGPLVQRGLPAEQGTGAVHLEAAALYHSWVPIVFTTGRGAWWGELHVARPEAVRAKHQGQLPPGTSAVTAALTLEAPSRISSRGP